VKPVVVASCAPEVGDAAIAERTVAAILAVPHWSDGLVGARKIAVKVNAGIASFGRVGGVYAELTDPAVVEGVVRAIRLATDAEIVLGDAPTHFDADRIYAELGLRERLRRYGRVRVLDFGEEPWATVAVGRPRPMFRTYQVSAELASADAFVSVAKMKAHSGMGFTLCIKNLFGWMPPRVYGSPRLYLHDRLIRLPRVLADLAVLWRPCLNVVDGIVATNQSEWHGAPLQPEVLLAGADALTVDTVGARVMGFDPGADYPQYPFHYRRNPLRLTAEIRGEEFVWEAVDVIGPAPEEVRTSFEVHRYRGGIDRTEQLRRGFACVESYRARRAEHVQRLRGRYLAMTGGEVLWDAGSVAELQRLARERITDWRDAPEFEVLCVDEAEENECLDRYAEEAARLPPPAP